MIEIGAAEELKNWVEQYKWKNKRIYMMGNVSNAYYVDSLLEKYGLELMGVVDNNIEKEGVHSFCDKSYEIVWATRFLDFPREDIILLVFSMRFCFEMREQMIRCGFIEGKDLFILEYPSLEKKKAYIQEGSFLIREYRKRFGDDAYIFIIHGPLGDNYLFLSLLKEYVKHHKLSTYVCLGCRGTEKLKDIFNLDNFVEISREELLSIEYLYMFLGNKLRNVKILQIWEFCFHWNRSRIRFNPRFNFFDTYRSYVYKLPLSVKAQLPMFENEDDVEQCFTKHGLKQNKTVVFSPYAYSIQHQPPKMFWIYLAEKIQEKGLDVVINIDSTNEDCFIPNGIPLPIPLASSTKYLEYAGAFIAMRSGFCDVVSSAKCKKIILYPRFSGIDYDRHRTDVRFGSLVAMGLSNDVIELEFSNEVVEDYWKKLAVEIVSNYVLN